MVGAPVAADDAGSAFAHVDLPRIGRDGLAVEEDAGGTGPAGDDAVALIATFGIFAVGFLMRPIGAIFFGYIGDKWGRKVSLALSILLMALPTACIGILPTYADIGIAAVDHGADCVYLGVRDATNARNFAGLNFDEAAIQTGIQYAHDRGRKVLVALNTYPGPARYMLRSTA